MHETPEEDGCHALATSAAIAGAFVLPAILVLSLTSEHHLTASVRGNRIPGYTVSLLLFVAPAALLACWFFRRSSRTERRAFWISLVLLVSITLVLDFAFGPRFFAWPNADSVVGIMVPAVGGVLPVEEIIFFISGFAFLLLTYIWCDEHWLAAHKRTSVGLSWSAGAWRLRAALVSLIGIILVGAVAYKKLYSATAEGFPGYLTYVLLVAILPPAWFFPSVSGSINWRAFSFTQLAMTLICLVWEVTLALPNQWWSYRPEMMTGIFISGWSDLPIEQPLVWLASPFTVVVVFESVKLRQRHSREGSRILLGLAPRAGSAG